MSQLSGMTGFARTEGQHENVRWVWEVRSVNGKGVEVRSRVPSGGATSPACGVPARARVGVRVLAPAGGSARVAMQAAVWARCADGGGAPASWRVD